MEQLSHQKIEFIILIVQFGIVIPLYLLLNKNLSDIDKLALYMPILSSIVCIYYIIYPDKQMNNFYKYVNKCISLYIIIGSCMFNSKYMLIL